MSLEMAMLTLIEMSHFSQYHLKFIMIWLSQSSLEQKCEKNSNLGKLLIELIHKSITTQLYTYKYSYRNSIKKLIR